MNEYFESDPRAKQHIRCKTDNCTNHTDEGLFKGDFCSPCAEFISITMDNSKTIFNNHSQAYKNWYNRQLQEKIDEIKEILDNHLDYPKKKQKLKAIRVVVYV
jgi:hypothetical protein